MFSYKVNSLKQNDSSYPPQLKYIFQPPEVLFYLGSSPEKWLDRPKVAIVGSRKISPYGQEITNRLASGLARAGVAIISGLAYGVDGLAHQSCLNEGGLTIAVLPTSLEAIYPAAHLNLARQIVEQGGTIITEYPKGSQAFAGNFIARNRIVSGLADVLLITEAAVNSGSLHTARFALEQGKTVMAVPGNVTSPTSEGCNNLIKSGAIPVTTTDDVFFALKISPSKNQVKNYRGTPEEEALLKMIAEGVQSQEELAVLSQLDTATVGRALTSLEIAGAVRPQGSGNWVAS